MTLLGHRTGGGAGAAAGSTNSSNEPSQDLSKERREQGIDPSCLKRSKIVTSPPKRKFASPMTVSEIEKAKQSAVDQLDTILLTRQ